MYVYMYVYAYVCDVYMYVYMYVYAYVCVYVCTAKGLRTGGGRSLAYACVHIHIHTYISVPNLLHGVYIMCTHVA